MSEVKATQELYEKLKKECLNHIQDDKEKELFLKRFIFALVRT